MSDSIIDAGNFERGMGFVIDSNKKSQAIGVDRYKLTDVKKEAVVAVRHETLIDSAIKDLKRIDVSELTASDYRRINIALEQLEQIKRSMINSYNIIIEVD